MKRFSKITTTQLARICGVSQGTVDRALHNRKGIAPNTKEHILSVAKEYDYVPLVRGTDQANSMLIGVVLFDLYNAYFSKLAMSMVNAAKRAGYSIIFQFSEKNIKNEISALEYFDYIGVDGIILLSVGSDSEEYENYLRSLKKPIVTVGNRLFHLPYIGIDDANAMFEITTALTARVCSGDILYYAPILKEKLHATNAQRLRLNGFLQAMARIDKRYRIITAVEEISNFGGIVCSTDYYALKVLEHLGYPKDVIISGFDNSSLVKNFSSQILTVEYSTDRIAEECVNYILGRPFTDKIEHKLTYNMD